MAYKMRRCLSAGLAVLVLLVSSGIPRAEEKYTAKDMQADCEGVIQSARSAKNPDELELENSFASGTCWGAFLSLQQIIVTKKEGGKNFMLQICAPPQTTLLQIILLFDLFVRSNTERQQEPFTKVAIAALRSAYPCR